MPVRNRTHDDLKEKYHVLRDTHRETQEKLETLHANYAALINRVDAVTAENASLSLFALDCLAWVHDAPLNVRGTKTPGLMQRKKELRKQALKLGILVEDAPVEAQEEKTA